MPLHLDHRPKDLGEVVGNRKTVRVLKSLMDRDRADWPHSFLFYGPSGTGKTTLARIVAHAVGGRGIDLIEQNTSNYTGVDAVREIIRDAYRMPMEGEAKVYVLDECHEMSRQAQDALLKPLEEPPDHVFFILCTTNPEKLLPTLRNRCMQLATDYLTEAQMRTLVKRVAEKELETPPGLPEDVINLIVEKSEGCPREAMVMLDSIIDLPPAKMIPTLQKLKVDETDAIKLCRLLMKKGTSWRELAEFLKTLRKEDSEKLRQLVLSYTTSVLLNSDSPRAYLVMSAFLEVPFNAGFAGIVAACYEIISGADV